MTADPQETLASEFDAHLRAYAEQAEIAAACRLVLSVGLRPLVAWWQEQYLKVPPTLEAHLKAQSELAAIKALAATLERLAASAPETREGLLDQLLREAEEELDWLKGEQAAAAE